MIEEEKITGKHISEYRFKKNKELAINNKTNKIAGNVVQGENKEVDRMMSCSIESRSAIGINICDRYISIMRG